MASELSHSQKTKKGRLIAEGCKVIERSWGHLVIMPTMNVALSYFKEALKGYDEGVAEALADTHMDGAFNVSPEYAEKYHKQFDHLTNPVKREKLYWVIEDAIQQGDPRKNQQVDELSRKLVDLVYEINPSLKLDVHHIRAENGDIWDAGLIGSDDPRPCWDVQQSQKIKRGSGGDGAYRIIINTDTSFGRSDSENALVLCAMIYVLQQYADVEIWVQQGWLPNHIHGHRADIVTDGGNPMNGITLFPAFRGAGMHPAQVLFWAGHPMRDSVFSRLINTKIGRTSSGCSHSAELDCDLYTRNGCFGKMPAFNFGAPDKFQEKQLRKLAEWVANNLSKVLLEEEDLAELTSD